MRSNRGQDGPSPFSSDFSEVPPPLPRRRPRLPLWIPSVGTLIALMIVFIPIVVAVSGGPSAPGMVHADATREAALALTPSPTTVVDVVTEQAPSPTPWPTPPTGEPSPTQMSGLAITPVINPPQSATTDPRAILPQYRIVSFYGQPHSEFMGIVGEMPKEELLVELREVAASFEAADPARPVMPAIELIASVAQNWPADNNTYLLHTDEATIQEYVDFTAENGILLILDLQIGHDTLRNEIDRIEKWLLYPHVHLAIDPEFAMPEGAIPGSTIGGVDASDITYAQERLAKLALDNDLPPKVLVVHQFYEGMIRNSETLAPVEGVQLVIEFDGFGAPANKIAGYLQFIRDRPIEFGGIKLFNKQDEPVMTPAELVALTPPPDLIIIQ